MKAVATPSVLNKTSQKRGPARSAKQKIAGLVNHYRKAGATAPGRVKA